MAVTINASTTTGLVQSADTSGIIQLQSNGTTAVTIDTNQRASFVAGTAALPAITTTGDTNTGIFFSAADTIDFAEGGTAVGQFDSSANFKFNSGYGSVATAFGCRAWVNFNGQGTIAIRGSGNVSSISDNGTGDYTVNFSTAMPNANYGVTATSTFQAGVTNAGGVVATRNTGNTTPDQTASGVRVITIGVTNDSEADSCQVNVSIFR
jgi:hypothetical protein